MSTRFKTSFLSMAISSVAILSLTACSSHQMNQLGLRSSSVNTYPNNMGTVELCEVANGYRATNQTAVSVDSEVWRRKLSNEQCDNIVKELYMSHFIRSLSNTTVTPANKPSTPYPTPLPAEPVKPN
ncbi:hypothetical protein [Vibrio methylphosphonaticus]|uniref:hypothetical protein n=1 Tax=Vibrio methylphosphonaticus TaxID=2946866 RepID=UPI00202A3EDB|nr:hypothetical protein [Vibrio methylphosphonaticus]MCL9775241.1 hypothetical protein [Vibrio methylphosphonaticus]